MNGWSRFMWLLCGVALMLSVALVMHSCNTTLARFHRQIDRLEEIERGHGHTLHQELPNSPQQETPDHGTRR